MPAAKHRFRFVVLGRYPARLKDNATAVTINVSAGDSGGHLVHCGTLTMSETEWGSFRDALRSSLGENVEVEDLPPAQP
jgi:hypothetical protein